MAFDLTARLDERRARLRFRQPTLMGGPCGRTAVVDGREHLNFCANDYLGLANDPEVVAARPTPRRTRTPDLLLPLP